MHSARPYGRFAEQAELSADDAAAVELLARRLTNFKAASDLESLKMVRTLPSGRQAVAVDMGGIFKVIVLERYEAPDFTFQGFAETHIPMLFSGVITKAQVRDGEGVGIKLTQQARRRIAGYADELPPKDVALQRFRIEYAQAFMYFKPQNTGIFTFTQYVKQRPTWYSGAMAQVVQVAGGYGKQVFADLPDDPVERARMLIPERFMVKIREQMGNVRLPGYTGFPDDEGQFQYRYLSSETDAVSFDTESKPWLVRISARGVHAMPLPLIPATTTDAFREYMDEVGDDEILALLDRFGGMPSGEGFPAAQADFESWRRAGVIIKVCDCADFYQHQAMYAACGWSLNSRGIEGFNTCYTYAESGLLHVYGYKLRLRLAAAKDGGKLPNSWNLEDPQDAARLDGYLSRLYQSLSGNDPKHLAIKYKIRRQSPEAILARNTDNMGGELDYWDGLEAEPIAAHAGNVSRVTSGPVYWGIKNPRSNGRLKFPTISGEGCASFDLTSPDYSGGLVRCDTVVFGCYVQDELQTVKYFIDERTFFRQEQSTYEDCMVVGAWQKTVTTGTTGLMGNFYTSSFDDRREASSVTTTTRVVGRDLGYGEPAYSTPPLLFCVDSLSRSRYFSHETSVDTTSGFSLDAGICVPVYGRDCIQYAYRQGTSGRSESKALTRHGMPDPTSYELWTYDNIFHYMGRTGSGNLGEPRPVNGSHVYVDTLVYLPGPCSDFADEGNWFNLPPGGFINVSGVCSPYTSREAGTHQASGVTIGGAAPPFEPSSSSRVYPAESSGRVSVSVSVAGSARVNNNLPHTWYFAFSPEDDSYFYQDMANVAIGDAEYTSLFEKDQYGLRKRWGHTALADHKSAHHFIGVINE